MSPSYELFWVLDGAATWTSGDQVVDVQPGTLLLTRPGIQEFFRWHPERPTRHAFVHFTVADPTALDAGDRPVTRAVGHKGEPLSGICEYLLWLGLTVPPGWRPRAEQALDFLISVFLDGPLPDDHSRVQLSAPITTMMTALGRQYWADGITRPVPLSQLASLACVSVSTLQREFRDQVGLSPIAALERLRLARTEPLLTMSNLTLAEIALRAGYADGYHYSRRFRAVYGIPPSIFRATRWGTAAWDPAQFAGLGSLSALLSVPTAARTSGGAG